VNARANENALARGASQGIEGVQQNTNVSNVAQPLNPAKKLTVLRAMGSQVLAKIWVGSRGLPEIQQFDEPRNFAVEPSPVVSNIDDLARELDRLASMRHHCVIRGEFVGAAQHGACSTTHIQRPHRSRAGIHLHEREGMSHRCR
jgi:hypothetical protein